MLSLVISSVEAIMQVMIVVFVGVILSRFNCIDNNTQKWLSGLNLTFFTPCLLFSSIAPVISYERLKAFWPIPTIYFIFFSISWILCRAVMPFFGVTKTYQRFIMACVLFANTNSLPVAIISSLAVSKAGKILYMSPDDTPELVAARGIAYTLFFGLFVNLARWSYGYNLLQKKSYDQETDEPIEYTGSNYGSISSSSEGRRSSSFTATEDMETNSIDEIAKYKYSNEQCKLLSSNKTSSTDTRLTTCFMNALFSLNKYMSPPLYAALLALIVGLIPPLKHVMYDKDSFVYVTLTMAIDSCGKVSVPVVMICLGAQLKSIRETQQAASPQMRKPVILTIFIRMFLTPLCVLPLAYLFAKYGQAWSELAADPMFIVSAVIIGCTPTAISLAQITQVSGIFEEEMLHVLFWSYGVICIPACTLIVFLALAIIS